MFLSFQKLCLKKMSAEFQRLFFKKNRAIPGLFSIYFPAQRSVSFHYLGVRTISVLTLHLWKSCFDTLSRDSFSLGLIKII